LRSGDPPAPAWDEIEPPALSPGGVFTGDVVLLHLRDALVLPRTGLVCAAAGVPVAATVLAGAPVPARLPAPEALRPRGAVIAGAGALRNYGHWMCDALPGLAWLDAAGLSARYPAILPPLPGWAAESAALFGLTFWAERAAAVRVESLILLTSLNHYLHRAGGLLQALADRLPRDAAPGPGRAAWLSRRGLTGRVLVEERRIEAALAAAGAVILRPQRMTPAAQRAAVSGLSVLAGPSGAAFANALFLPRGARLVEVRPAPVAEPWMAAMAAALDLRLMVVPGGGPLPREAVPLSVRLAQLPRRLAGRYHYAWSADADAVTAAVQTAAFMANPRSIMSDGATG
jgi:capsular polysaccharide biosynthesis protein